MKRAKWRQIFLELAIRGIIQVHHKYNVWELGQHKTSLTDFENLNQGNGIFFAPEEHVRDVIAQQLIETGLWKEHSIEDDDSSYVIDREFLIRIPNKDLLELDSEKIFTNIDSFEEEIIGSKRFKVDLVFKRLQPLNPDESATLPVLIEAKRFEVININLITKKPNVTSTQISGIDRDIWKLKVIKSYIKKNSIEFYGEKFEDVFTYLLVWGQGGIDFDLNENLYSKLEYKEFIELEYCITKRIPIKWTNENEMKVSKFIWIALIAIK